MYHRNLCWGHCFFLCSFASIEEVVFALNFKAMMYAGDTQLYVTINSADDCPPVLINPLSPGVKLQILLFCFHTFLTDVVGRSC